MLQQFDYFIVVDWSAKAKAGPRKESKDAIWVGEGTARRASTPRYFRTRQSAYDHILQKLLAHSKRGKRVLVAWDFAFGYPQGMASALRLKTKDAWLRIWKQLDMRIRDKDNNANNRFTVAADFNRRISGGGGPFWGIVGRDQSGVLLRPNKDFKYPVKNRRAKLAERRLVEQRLKKTQPVWKLAYAGSVGSQTLLGIPRVHQLSRDRRLADCTRIWPFQTDFAEELPPEGKLIVHAEVYPSHLKLPGKDSIRDREQVRTYVKWLQREQADGQLTKWLSGPADLSKKERKQVLSHEGWILGVN